MRPPLTPLKPHAGKNRALDDDELEFIAAVEGAKAAQEAAWEAEQNRELDGFREVGPSSASAALWCVSGR